MGRRQARETALQTLYQVEVGKIEPNTALQTMLDEFVIGKEDGEFASALVKGVITHQQDIDEVIQKLIVSWNFKRLAKVDLSALRLAIYELMFGHDVPPNVAVNEAIELAKTFSGEEAGKFVNGVLGKVVENLQEYRGGNS